MKKILLISLLAMMLIGMLTFSACKPQPQTEEAAAEEMVEEVEEATDAAEEVVDEAAEEAVEVTE